MSPGHILPLRAVGVVLIIKVPYTVFVEHTIRVVHPAIEGSVVKGRTVGSLAVCGVESVTEAHILPAGIAFCFAHRATALVGYYVEHHLVSAIGSEIERYEEVGFRFCEAHIDCFSEIAINEHIHTCIIN